MKMIPNQFFKIDSQKGNKVVTFMWVYTETTTKQTYSLLKELMNMEYFRNQNSKHKIWWAQNKQKTQYLIYSRSWTQRTEKPQILNTEKKRNQYMWGGTSVEGNEMIFDKKKKKNSRCVKFRALLF